MTRTLEERLRAYVQALEQRVLDLDGSGGHLDLETVAVELRKMLNDAAWDRA